MTLLRSIPCCPDWPSIRETYGTAGLLLSLSLEEAARRFRGRAAYLATPLPRYQIGETFSRTSDRFLMARRVPARWVIDCAERGMTAISPMLLLSSALAADCRGRCEELDPAFLTRWCEPLIREARLVLIPPVSGWEIDRGVWDQARVALAHNIHVVLLLEDAK